MNQLQAHLTKLCLEIGCRPIGSPANERAAAYLRTVFESCGLRVEEQEYACTGWEVREARLQFGGRSLPLQANAFSPACEVTAPLVPVRTLEELTEADLTGRIALFYGAIAQSPLAAKSWFLRGERDDFILGHLEAKHPAALLAPPVENGHYEQFTSDWELDLPAATLPAEAMLELLATAEPVHLLLDCRRFPAKARNVVGSRPAGSGEIRKKVCLMAHFDTRINTPGAVDNAGGCAALLGLAEALATCDLPFALEFIAFNGEEYLPMGDDEYLRRRGEASFRDILLAVNLDGIGQTDGQNTIARFNTPPAMEAWLLEVVGRYPELRWVEPWPESNHSTFAFRGVPALAFSSQGGRSLSHRPTDTIEAVDTAKLAEAVAVVAELIQGRWMEGAAGASGR